MGILDEDVARVRAATDFVQLASASTSPSRRSGQRWYQGLCPFHAEKSPSFSVNAEEGLCYCFGCQAKGDVITFVREVEHLDFVEAVERLAARAGIQLRYDDAAAGQDRQRREPSHSRRIEQGGGVVPRAAADGARRRTGPRVPPVPGLRRRRRPRSSSIGWAPDDWDALARHLRLPDDVLTRHRARVRQPAATASRTRSGPG